jgi:hypothetical protein
MVDGYGHKAVCVDMLCNAGCARRAVQGGLRKACCARHAVQGMLCKAGCVRSLDVGNAWKRAHGVVYAEGSAAVSPDTVFWAMHSAVV